MKRRLLIAVIFLPVGAIVNVAVAWGVVLLVDTREWTYVNVIYTRVEWPRDVPDHWPQADTIHGWKTFGFLRRSYEADFRVSKHCRASYAINTTGAGWPCLSLESESWKTSATSDPPDGWNRELPKLTHWRTGLLVPSKYKQQPTLIPEGWDRLPVHPLRLGFAVNTVFYATMLWLLICGAFVLRRLIRVRRGLCPACAYPMGESAVCSECGTTLPTVKGTDLFVTRRIPAIPQLWWCPCNK